MKRSELKEAIKAEIISVLSESTGIFGTSIRDLDQYEPEDFGIEIGDIVTLGGDGDELEVIDKRRMFGSDMMAYRVKFPDGNTEEYSSDQLRLAEGDLKEEDEPTDAEIKKADSVASAANKLQKLVKKMKDKAKDFKSAEGEAKEKIKDELKAMTAEKKKLEKSL